VTRKRDHGNGRHLFIIGGADAFCKEMWKEEQDGDGRRRQTLGKPKRGVPPDEGHCRKRKVSRKQELRKSTGEDEGKRKFP